MHSKLLSFILILTISLSSGQYGWYPWEGNEKPMDGDMACDQPVCVEPCPDAAPPRYCPLNSTSCASGCACMLECKSPTYVCYQTKFCVSRRRYLKRRTTHPNVAIHDLEVAN